MKNEYRVRLTTLLEGVKRRFKAYLGIGTLRNSAPLINNKKIYGEGFLLHGIAFFDTIAYNGQLYFSFLLTINRFSAFILPSVNVFLFTGKRIYA
ncbi:hypothetical protein L596_021988 [Steinernema carpocapsae]|nr:hypothetical protein L596_021988 [Steinernema carpocapsae]